MEIVTATFKCSSSELKQIPNDSLPEFAFIGRSNVGKSSLINMITNTTDLAKVSSTPGKTRLINHFLINDSWYIVDLPGYGYAKASKQQRRGFLELIEQYIINSPKMHFLFVLVDSRHEPQAIDINFITRMGELGIPFGIVFTKSDKQSQRQTSINIANYEQELHKTWQELPPRFITSSQRKAGKEQILDFIDECMRSV